MMPSDWVATLNVGDEVALFDDGRFRMIQKVEKITKHGGRTIKLVNGLMFDKFGDGKGAFTGKGFPKWSIQAVTSEMRAAVHFDSVRHAMYALWVNDSLSAGGRVDLSNYDAEAVEQALKTLYTSLGLTFSLRRTS